MLASTLLAAVDIPPIKNRAYAAIKIQENSAT
jgi:hypothetical protein